TAAAGLALLAALAAAGLGLWALDERLTSRLGALTVADPTPELVARYGLRPLTRKGVAHGPEGEESQSWEEPVGPIVVGVGPDATRLGLGAIHAGDWFVFVGGSQPRTVKELKRTLADTLERNPSAHAVSCRYVYGPGDTTRAGWGSTDTTLDLTALSRPSLRARFGDVPGYAIAEGVFFVEVLLLLGALTVIERRRPGHAGLRCFLIAFGVVVVASELGVVALVTDALI